MPDPAWSSGTTQPQEEEIHNIIEDTNNSTNFYASLIKAVVIGGLLFAIYYFYSYQTNDLSSDTPAPEEARRKRLEKLEQETKSRPKEKEEARQKINPKIDSRIAKPTETSPDDDMQILRLKRPPPEQQQEQRSASASAAAARAAKKRNENTSPGKKENQKEEAVKPTSSAKPAAPAPAAKPTAPTKLVVSSVKPAATEDNKQPKKRKAATKHKSPREALLQALSSITGMTVTTPSSPTPTGCKSKAATIQLQLSETVLPANASWNDIQSKDVFQPFHSYITSNTKESSTHQYGPTKLSDRRLSKASDWYRKSKTWVRDHASVLDDDAQTGLQQILDEFQTWIVQALALQLKEDVSQLDSSSSSAAFEDDDDEDHDMGLFADDAYGGGGGIATSTVPKNDDDQTLLGELLFLLSDPSAPKVLTKPFLAHIQQVYGGDQLATSLFQQCLQRLPAQKTKLEWDATQKHITAITHLLTLTPDAIQAALPPTDPPEEGKAWEEQSTLRPLLCLAAYTVPRFNDSSNSANLLVPLSFHSNLVAALGAHYPVALYATPGSYDDPIRTYHGCVKNARTVLQAARAAGAIALKKLAAQKVLFQWLGGILETNEPLVDMLQSDLLSPDSAQALCALRPFLLGIAASLLQLCTANLQSKLKDAQVDAFDYRYFVKEEGETQRTGIVVSSPERCLMDNNKDQPTTKAPAVFTGATEFFFLTAALLRIGLFPGFRVDEEFQSTRRGVFAQIQQLAAGVPAKAELERISRQSMEQLQKCCSVTQGWLTFVDDPALSPLITTFALLQLEWVSLACANPAAVASIPEWFVKLPSQWLAHVAMYTPHLLQPNEGEAAVQYATRILQAGTKTNSPKQQHAFSPPVLCQLIRIAGAFVREGVRRARFRETRKSNPRRRGFKKQAPAQSTKPTDDQDFETDIIDDRALDIYHSFDARDLGVTVFTNDFVAQHLCPTLMRAYMAMDAVEGMDVEREHHFEKFEVKHEVADLLLRLWCHPNGQSRNAIVKDLDEVAMNEFCSSIAGALGFQMDQSCQFILDIRDIKAAHESSMIVAHARSRGREPPPLSRRDEAAIEHHAKFISFSLYQCRRLLLILCSFSKEDKIASILGGQSSSKKNMGKSAAPDLACMLLNLMERLTDEDGGIHPELEKRQLKPGERSAVMLSHLGSIAPGKLQESLHYLLHSRRFALLEYGLDVSLLTHQFLALAARWHLAGASVDKEGKRTSNFLEAVVRSDICDSKRLRNVFRRLVGAPSEMTGSEADNAAYILERDGHVDLTIWKDSYKFEGSGPDKGKNRKRTAKQDRMSHSDLESLVELKDIEAFLSDLEEAEAGKNTFAVAARWGSNEMQSLEGTLFTTGELLADDDYTESLQEWVVSSDSFLSSAGNGSFAHSYDSIVRGRSVEGMGAGKILAKEARKCIRLIPAPHPNTSVFVCFAEERTDLCKAIIIGAEQTPFSLGMFEFDILFPTNYPQSPPLFNFKTTGDGRTRISSNLYNDGKVCISILGTYQAFDDSQRWSPSTSSLAQVLASLQTQLLGDAEPYFSDGFNHDSVRGTPAGERGSKRFNNKIRLHTLRYAIIAPLKHPPLGFDEVTKRHFALCRKRVLVQARLWTNEARGTPLHKSFIRAYEELLTLLFSDDLVRHKAPGQTEDKAWGAVPLHAEDFKGLEQGDRSFVQLHQHALRGCLANDDAKPAAVGSPENPNMVTNEAAPMNFGWEGASPCNNAPPSDYNPWAAGASGVAPAGVNENDASGGADDDDDDLYA